MFGGLLFGMKDKKLKLPHRNRRSENIVEVGFLADILFGFAGGYVVFLILPAFTFDINLANVVKIVALSTVGGYGGRALVERVLTTQLQKLEDSIQELQDQNSMDGKALALLTQQLDADPDKPSTSPEEIQKILELASSRLKALAFSMARDFRKDQLYAGHLDSLDRAEPVFRALINLDPDHKYHRNLAQLGYLLKDKHPHDFRNAEKYLTQAITVRDTRSEPGFVAYEFNRAICRIALNRPAAEIIEDLNRAMGGETTRYWVQNPHPTLAEGLVQWLQTDETGQKWAAAHKITLDQ
jgi:tetratricopeptide (TPR) repeat protein